MAELALVEAVRLALARAMEEDDAVLVLGEDVGVNGGVFRATEGLLERFGERRVFDTPLSEALFAGLAVGLGAQGFRPVVEFQFMGFMYPALDQVANHAGRLRNRTRGRLTCPGVLRAPYGGGIHLLAAIRDPDPVIFLEPKRIYRAPKEEVADDGESALLDRCFILREGRDLTLVAWGAMTVETLAAAEQLADDGIEAEVVDVATLKPLDMETILGSVERSGRCVIVQEAPLTAGFGAEIAARLAEHGLMALQAPVKRVAGYDTVMPLPRLEKFYMPTAERILQAARETLEYA
jgi:pyruvate dehydrogenase E1 component beta subunit